MEDERPYYGKDEYYKFYSSVDSDGDRLQTFEEKKATTSIFLLPSEYVCIICFSMI